MTLATATAIGLAAAGLVVLALLYVRRRRSGRHATWIMTGVAAAAGAGLCYVPHPRMADIQVFGVPFPVGFSVFTTKLTALQPLGVFAVASWILNALLVRELILLVAARGDAPADREPSSSSAASRADEHERSAPSATHPRSARRSRAR